PGPRAQGGPGPYGGHPGHQRGRGQHPAGGAKRPPVFRDQPPGVRAGKRPGRPGRARGRAVGGSRSEAGLPGPLARRRHGGGDGGGAVTDRVWAKVDELAASLQDTDAYRSLQAARQQVEEREAARIMLRDVQRLQDEIAQKQASGEPVGEELMERLQQRLQLVALNPYVREYLQAEAAFAQLLVAVQVRLAEQLGLPA